MRCPVLRGAKALAVAERISCLEVRVRTLTFAYEPFREIAASSPVAPFKGGIFVPTSQSAPKLERRSTVVAPPCLQGGAGVGQ